MKNKFIVALLFAFLFSCNETKNTTPSIQNETKEHSVALEEPQKETNLASILELFSNNRANIILKLENTTNEEANKLYEKYIEENQPLLDKIYESEANLLDNFYSDDESVKKNLDNFVGKLKKHHLQIEEIGEGYVQIATVPDFYYKLFSNYVSKDYKEYLYLKSEENKELYSADAGLAISFKELGERIISWENFIEKYPNSTLLEGVKEEYKAYQLDYLVGMDNTPTMDKWSSEEKYIYPENLTEFNRFLKKYPNSPTNQLIQLFLENFKQENIVERIIEEQSKI